MIADTQAATAWIWNILWNLLQWLFWALLYVLGVGLIVATLFGLYWLVRDTINRWNRRPEPTNPAPTPQQTAPAPDDTSETQKASVATPVATPRPDSSKSTETLRAVPARGSFGPAREGSEKPKAVSRRLRVDISGDGNVYTKSRGYTSFLVEQDEEGNTMVRTNPN